ncbi:Transcriptional regulator, MerR family [Fulvivirga imtechensis AK7]|uniref:Transcriptional regulator, MerR family n=1 Tax=Fulvivirga imtechensis AK7 TaxID=1237149 RepID=L8JTI3_9BACT|nr:MerR family transcriptional regulator [Fulvivirga imtechensis]ELR70642.1 Transcriptional regulator, MerR family [Fulvivirga imtechensis AK7]
MGKYSIKELEKLSGIKAHTIRIWEKRYGIIKPQRTSTNIRYYSDDDLKKILNISILNGHGYKISKIAALSTNDISAKVMQLTSERSDLDLLVDELTLCMVEMDEVKFDKLLSSYIVRFGFEKTILSIVYPFLDKVGILWLSDNISPIQEHFVSNLVRQKIIVAIDGLPLNSEDSAEKVLLFLPENELHEIGLLFFYYLLKKQNYKTIYLGQYVPLKDLEEVVNTLKPNHLVTCITYSPRGKDIEEFITLLSEKFYTCQIYVTGKPVLELSSSFPKNIHIFQNAKDLKDLL